VSDVAYFSRKIPVGENCLLLESDRKCGYSGRNFFCTAAPSPEMVRFMEYRPGQDGKGAKKLEPGELSPVENHELPFRVSSFPIDHSIFGATAFILEGDLSIAYTGDFRLHGKNGDHSKKFVKEAKNSSILIMEGTRAGRTSETMGSECGPDPQDGAFKDTEKSPTEETVFENCLGVVEESSKLVIADFSPRNFERLQSFYEVARKTGRNLVVTAKDDYLLNSLEYAGLDLGLEDFLVYNEFVDKSQRKWEIEFVSETHDYANHDEITLSPEQYLLCFSLFDLKHLLDIKPGGDDYIYSSCEAFSEEMVIDFQKIWNWTKYFGFDVHGFSMEIENGSLKPRFNHEYHVSGHASKEDLLWTVDHVDPDFIIPVHTTGNRWFTDNFDNVKIMEKGIEYGF
jgi:ribonuclease J